MTVTSPVFNGMNYGWAGYGPKPVVNVPARTDRRSRYGQQNLLRIPTDGNAPQSSASNPTLIQVPMVAETSELSFATSPQIGVEVSEHLYSSLPSQLPEYVGEAPPAVKNSFSPNEPRSACEAQLTEPLQVVPKGTDDHVIAAGGDNYRHSTTDGGSLQLENNIFQCRSSQNTDSLSKCDTSEIKKIKAIPFLESHFAVEESSVAESVPNKQTIPGVAGGEVLNEFSSQADTPSATMGAMDLCTIPASGPVVDYKSNGGSSYQNGWCGGYSALSSDPQSVASSQNNSYYAQVYQNQQLAYQNQLASMYQHPFYSTPSPASKPNVESIRASLPQMRGVSRGQTPIISSFIQYDYGHGTGITAPRLAVDHGHGISTVPVRPAYTPDSFVNTQQPHTLNHASDAMHHNFQSGMHRQKYASAASPSNVNAHFPTQKTHQNSFLSPSRKEVGFESENYSNNFTRDHCFVSTIKSPSDHSGSPKEESTSRRESAISGESSDEDGDKNLINIMKSMRKTPVSSVDGNSSVERKPYQPIKDTITEQQKQFWEAIRGKSKTKSSASNESSSAQPKSMNNELQPNRSVRDERSDIQPKPKRNAGKESPTNYNVGADSAGSSGHNVSPTQERSVYRVCKIDFDLPKFDYLPSGYENMLNDPRVRKHAANLGIELPVKSLLETHVKNDHDEQTVEKEIPNLVQPVETPCSPEQPACSPKHVCAISSDVLQIDLKEESESPDSVMNAGVETPVAGPLFKDWNGSSQNSIELDEVLCPLDTVEPSSSPSYVELEKSDDLQKIIQAQFIKAQKRNSNLRSADCVADAVRVYGKDTEMHGSGNDLDSVPSKELLRSENSCVKWKPKNPDRKRESLVRSTRIIDRQAESEHPTDHTNNVGTTLAEYDRTGGDVSCDISESIDDASPKECTVLDSEKVTVQKQQNVRKPSHKRNTKRQDHVKRKSSSCHDKSPSASNSALCQRAERTKDLDGTSNCAKVGDIPISVHSRTSCSEGSSGGKALTNHESANSLFRSESCSQSSGKRKKKKDKSGEVKKKRKSCADPVSTPCASSEENRKKAKKSGSHKKPKKSENEGHVSKETELKDTFSNTELKSRKKNTKSKHKKLRNSDEKKRKRSRKNKDRKKKAVAGAKKKSREPKVCNEKKLEIVIHSEGSDDDFSSDLIPRDSKNFVDFASPVATGFAKEKKLPLASKNKVQVGQESPASSLKRHFEEMDPTTSPFFL